MRSQTVTVRINLDALISCAEIIQRNGVDPATQPISTTVRTVIEGICELMRRQGRCTIFAEDAIDQTFIDLYQQQAKEEGDVNLDFEELDSIVKQDSRILEISESVDKQLSPGFTPKIVRSTTAQETDEIPVAAINLFSLFARPFHELAALAPKDKYIESLSNQNSTDSETPEQKLFRQAVRVAYTGLEVENWGSKMADNLIRDLLKAHRE